MAWSSASRDTLDTVDTLDMLELLDAGRVVVLGSGFVFSSSLSFVTGTEPSIFPGALDRGRKTLSFTGRGLGLPLDLVRECKTPSGGVATAAAFASVLAVVFVCAETLLDLKAPVGEKNMLFAGCGAAIVELRGCRGGNGLS